MKLLRTARARARGGLVALAVAVALVWPSPVRAQQDLGHKLLGTLGVDAGVQPPAGLYLADRVVYYHANRLVDRDGAELPVGLDIDAFANAFGLRFSVEVPALSTFFNVSGGIPVATAHINSERPEASIDRYGLGDLYVQPLSLGWRLPGADIVTGYAFYAPTGKSTPGGSGGIGRGHWTHQYSLGGAVFFDEGRRWRASALGSYDLNLRKTDVDITRGSTVQIQGGAGGQILPAVGIGLAGYALWQVTDDTGSDLPPQLRGARDRAYGLGPEVSLLVPAIRSRIGVRYVHDVSVRSRPEGGLLSLELSVMVWRPGGEQAGGSSR